MRGRVTAAALMTAGLVLAPAGAASADPVIPGDSATLDCDNGQTYDIVVKGNGEFTPAHDVGSTGTFVATSFGSATGTLTTATGAVVDSFSDPASQKGGQAGKERATTTTCDFVLIATIPDEKLGPLTLTVEGTVTGFLTPPL